MLPAARPVPVRGAAVESPHRGTLHSWPATCARSPPKAESAKESRTPGPRAEGLGMSSLLWAWPDARYVQAHASPRPNTLIHATFMLHVRLIILHPCTSFVCVCPSPPPLTAPSPALAPLRLSCRTQRIPRLCK